MEGREGVVVAEYEGGGGSGSGRGAQDAVQGGWEVTPAAPPEGAGFTIELVGSGSGGGEGSEGDPAAAKKRGRPRKYGPESLALVPSPTAASASPFSPGSGSSDGRRGRGRPRGTGSRQLLAALGNKQTPPIACSLDFLLSHFCFLLVFGGECFTFSAGGGFTPHVVTIATGEDVVGRIRSFSEKGPRAVCILSANGSISNATLHQPGSSGGTLTYEGRFEILSLSGSFSTTATQGVRNRTGLISVSLAGPDGRVIGGGVAGLLLAASPIQMIVGSFKPNTFKNQQAKPSQPAELATFPVITSLTAARPISQANPDDDCETPTSSLHGQNRSENSVRDPILSTILHQTSSWHGLQSPDHKPSPDINIRLHGE
ncbi:AT-hook motif nuclear-localized protein 7-like isoform X3 [Zingiber officinale]|uniref:AT-hook motif nuclear-localized protein 7-like isoform X3 n=1 Tax=Zingiber officinale TaxID=94328 RepID=UPI001C4B3A64|nr:AT-hook motif nuclear-localized protein 7-like isoform X3 [Zingiber officinale]